jgi:8-oxo-dGTP diphosphatase
MTDSFQPRHVVTCFLRRRGAKGQDEILILRRSERVGSYRGHWAGVSGYVEGGPLAQALVEIQEETGLAANEVSLVKRGEPLAVDDEERDFHWVVHPFLFDVRSERSVRLDWEHIEARWIEPKELAQYETVPLLAEALERVYTP